MKGLSVGVDDHQSDGGSGHDGNSDECGTVYFHDVVLTGTQRDAGAQCLLFHSLKQFSSTSSVPFPILP